MKDPMVTKALEILNEKAVTSEDEAMCECDYDIESQFAESPQFARLLSELDNEEVRIGELLSVAVRTGFSAGVRFHRELTGRGPKVYVWDDEAYKVADARTRPD